MEVKNPFETMSLSQVADALDELRGKAEAVFARHKSDGGDIAFENFSEEDTEIIRDANEKLALAQQRWEKLNEMRDASEKLANLADFVNRPRDQVAQPRKKTLTHRDAGAAFAAHKQIAEGQWRQHKDRDVEVALTQFLPGVGIALKRAGVLLPGFPFASKATLGTDDTLGDVDVEFPPEVTRYPQIGIVNILAQPPNIADLCIQVATAQNAIKYMEQTTRTSAAAETAEGAAYSEASYEWTERTDPIRKIGHIFPVTEEVLDDNPFLRGIVNSEMRMGVLEREDAQLLSGDGTGQNIEGIINRTNVQNVNYSLAAASAQTYAEAILSGITNTAKQFRRASAIVLSLTTWQFLRLAKDSQNRYLFAGLQDEAVPRLWGLPLVPNENMDDYDTATNIGALVGAFASDAYVVRRDGVELSVSDSHSDYFARDTLTLKARERVGLAVTRPAAFTTVTTTA